MATIQKVNSKVLRNIRADLVRQRDCIEKTTERDYRVMCSATENYTASEQRLRDANERIEVLDYYMRLEGISIVGTVEDTDKG